MLLFFRFTKMLQRIKQPSLVKTDQTSATPISSMLALLKIDPKASGWDSLIALQGLNNHIMRQLRKRFVLYRKAKKYTFLPTCLLSLLWATRMLQPN